MKKVSWERDDGHQFVSLLRDNDPDNRADAGVPIGPPDVRLLDWDAIQKDLNNGLYHNELFTEADLAEKSNQFTGVILSAIRKRLIALYRG